MPSNATFWALLSQLSITQKINLILVYKISYTTFVAIPLLSFSFNVLNVYGVFNCPFGGVSLNFAWLMSVYVLLREKLTQISIRP